MTKWVGTLIIANVAVYFMQSQLPDLANALAFVPALALLRPWTAITYMFLHASFSHIAFNMLGLYFFGPQVEDRLGGARFLTLYFVSGLSGAATSMVFSQAGLVGASAGVFGVQLAFAYFWPRAKLLIWGIVPVEARTLIVIMTIVSLVGGAGIWMRGIGHFAHLGGFLGGWLVLRLSGVRRVEDKLRPVQMRERTAAASPGDAQRWKKIPLERLHPVNREEAERVLAKLDARGLSGLTAEDQAFLNRFTEI
jgi:membrane associated rhomboid family serine protease